MHKFSASLVVFLVMSASPFRAVEAATLLGYWNFEEDAGTTVLDQSSFENHGELTGATRSEGKVGRGLSFDGSGGVTIPNSPSLDLLPGGFTMSAWIKPTSYPDFITIFFKTDRNNLVNQLHFQVDGRLYAAMNTPVSQGGFEGIGPNTVTLNEWHYVTWTFDEQTQRFYDNGVEVFSAPYTQPWVGNNEVLQIGQHRQLPIANFRGLIDEAKIYLGALTSKDILRDMHCAPQAFLQNGCFEEGKLGWRGWSGQRMLTTETSYDGQVAAKILFARHRQRLTHDTIPISGGQAYEIKAAIKTVNATGTVFVQLDWLSPRGRTLRTDSFGATSGTVDWTVHTSGVLTTPPDATKLRLRLITEPGSGTAYFDAVQVEQ